MRPIRDHYSSSDVSKYLFYCTSKIPISCHNDIITWKKYPHYWLIVRESTDDKEPVVWSRQTILDVKSWFCTKMHNSFVTMCTTWCWRPQGWRESSVTTYPRITLHLGPLLLTYTQLDFQEHVDVKFQVISKWLWWWNVTFENSRHFLLASIIWEFWLWMWVMTTDIFVSDAGILMVTSTCLN